MKKKKCGTCWGFGIWAIGDPSPIGEMDAWDGCPVKKCPECGSKGIPKNVWRTLDGRLIPYKKLTNAHLKNIIKHIRDRDPEGYEKKLLNKVLREQSRRKKLKKKDKLFKKKFNQK